LVINACAPQSQTVPKTLRKIGYLSGNKQASVDRLSIPFRDRLREVGYLEGRDISIEFAVADNVNERLAGLAAGLVGIPVDVLLAEAGPAQFAAQKATAKIPIVMVLATDPVAQGLVASMARPGGNITGVTTASYELAGKQVELLREIVPRLSRLAVIGNAVNTTMTVLLPAVEEAARRMNITVEAFGVHGPEELDAALARIASGGFDALLMLPALSVVRSNDQVPAFANQIGLPQIYSDIEFAQAGGLMQYSANFAAMHRRAAEYVDKILRGARPADLPIEQPPQIDLVVNRSSAQKLGLTIPESIQRRATTTLP
jgi:putative ABC transport system substrate-binding protein